MAMETLASGVPTVLSSNTGHIDLIESGIKHIIGLKAIESKILYLGYMVVTIGVYG